MFDDLEEALAEIDNMTDEEFDEYLEKSLSEIGESMKAILEEDPDATPMLEKVAKLLTMVAYPEQYSHTKSVETSKGTYTIVAAPSLEDNSWCLSVALFPKDAHHIGPAILAKFDTEESAAAAIPTYEEYVKGTLPTTLIDINSKWKFTREGVFMPYETSILEEFEL